ncbi:hypothetical protein AX15_005141 [Amanita polypyramis BW_CC]|nr:hypothetical protein AX15_005141 [Amanita polypyramis BW_CC]
MSFMNHTACINLSGDDWLRCPNNIPFYFSSKEYLIDEIPDRFLAVASPIIAYWAFSMFFHCLDVSGWKWLEKYRIHDSEEIRTKNLVSRSQVVWAVILQHVIQTLLGLAWMSEEKGVSNHVERMQDIKIFLQPILIQYLGERGQDILPQLTYLSYWWFIPAAQIIFAMFIIDSWQYFLHRLMHTNKFLYRHFHSWHHRLYVPYAFGSLYNHPVEGFLLDSLGVGLAEMFSRMTTRQAMVLFIISTFKTVDDHCGYSLPFDPLQLLTSNNADYHDIHHQVIGIKFNFAQPFFVHWDMMLGTRLTRQDIERRHGQAEAKMK